MLKDICLKPVISTGLKISLTRLKLFNYPTRTNFKIIKNQTDVLSLKSLLCYFLLQRVVTLAVGHNHISFVQKYKRYDKKLFHQKCKSFIRLKSDLTYKVLINHSIVFCIPTKIALTFIKEPEGL